ncbi:MAG: RnfABCDGE type electron transport complex subunit D [Proteobacteria bacterium]|nr:RnfABCDGE type electron transport complex subunit D [Pseudomonadota bacterium]
MQALLERLRQAFADPRHGQIAALLGLTLVGQATGRLDTSLWGHGVALAAALATQRLLDRWQGRRHDPRSPFISGLSIGLLLRADAVWVLALAAVLAIASKGLVRWRGKHVFNPTNVAIVALSAAHLGWVSPGQWGTDVLLAGALMGTGALVLVRAARFDITAAFLATLAGLLFTRALWLGDPLALPLHQLQSGSLLVFAFFMLSDPKTTPDARGARLLFAASVATAAFAIQVFTYRPDAVLLALCACAPLVPLLDALWPAERFRWPGAPSPSPSTQGEPRAELQPTVAAGGRVLARRLVG